MPDIQKRVFLLVAASLLLYVVVGYFLERHHSAYLITTYGLLFIMYVVACKTARGDELKFWLFASFAFRGVLLLSLPNLSDDFYRFIWDGRLLAQDIHPFAELPGYYLTNNTPGLDQWLYDHLNSQEYFTVYPPLAQYVFWLAAVISPKSILGSVIVMRIVVIAAEAGSVFLLWNLLPRFGASRKDILWYALNPLVVLELSGNLHFEALVIFFLLWALHLISQSKILQAGLSFALAVSAKLLPLIFLPQFLVRMGLRRSVIYYSTIVAACILISLPLFDWSIVQGTMSSLSLYFQKFEFNASIFYLFRAYGFWTKGYDTIQTVGSQLALASTIMILMISFWPFEKISGTWRLKQWKFPFSIEESPKLMMWALFIYLLFATTVHPWYITTLLVLSLFTHFKFPVVWTGMIFLTYAGYLQNGFSENLYLTIVEYLVVFGWILYELIWKREAKGY